MRGNWRKAYDYLSSVSSWNLLPNKAEVLDMLKAKLQECGLRTYLLSYGSFYRSLSQAQLCEMFDLPEKQVGPAVLTCLCVYRCQRASPFGQMLFCNAAVHLLGHCKASRCTAHLA